MRIDELPKVVIKRTARRGQGRGSGSGHTSGRGNKGQKARGRVGVLFEGTKWKKSLVRRLPFLRGKGRMKGRPKPILVKLESLEKFASGAKVDTLALVEKGIVDKEGLERGVKVVGSGKLGKKLVVAVPVSKAVVKVIEAAGGEVRE